ncbi:MAG: hypothetical protein CSA75_02040 [Sorangium cellulosum]|nr:MAG: hypothetical protein CSA75_02040 [Sorangium cellulosum]
MDGKLFDGGGACQIGVMFVHPSSLEFEISDAAEALRAGYVARRTGRWSVDDVGPLARFRALLTKDRYLQLDELPQDLPTLDSLRRWMAHLIIERVTWDDRVSTEVARHDAEHLVMGLGASKWSVRSLIQELIRTSNQGRRNEVAEALVRVSSRASEESIWWLRRRQAAAIELGLESLGWLESPLQGVTTKTIANRLLDATHEIAKEAVGDKPWQGALWAGSAMDAQEGWPAKLTPRWYRAMFGGWRPLSGLRMDVGPMPIAMCGASFVRALVRFGGAVHTSCAFRGGVPFCLAVRPFDMGRACYGALFGGLLSSVPFLRRRLGLGTLRARQQAARMGRSMLVALRLNAAKAVLSSQVDALEVVNAHVVYGSRALCTTIPDELAAVVPRYDPRSAAWFVGSLRAAQWTRLLIETYDEDWFDNPRAHEHLATVDVTRPVVMADDEVDECVLAAVAWAAEVMA